METTYITKLDGTEKKVFHWQEVLCLGELLVAVALPKYKHGAYDILMRPKTPGYRVEIYNFFKKVKSG